MVRWIAFDDDTAEAVVCRFRRGAAEIRQGNALDAALGQSGNSLLLMPASSPERLLLITVSNHAPSAHPALADAALEDSDAAPRSPRMKAVGWWHSSPAE